MRHISVFWFAVAAMVMAALVRPALGGGIEVINQGAAATGQAEAFAAQADDPTAIYYNPAGLTQLHGANGSFGAYLLDVNVQKKDGPSGSESLYQPTVLPHFYVESDFGLQSLRFGIGLNNVFGLKEDWGNTGPLSTLVDKASLVLLNLAPTFAYKINDQFSLGGELNVYYGQVELRRETPLGPPPTPDGAFRFQGHSEALGGTVGLTWKVDDKNTFAATYRSGFSMDFHGHARVSTPGPELGPSPADIQLDFPEMAGVAYAYRPVKPWKLEADVVWTDWSTSFNYLALHSSNPQFNGISIKEHWMDSFSYRFGTQYELNSNWTVRGGYAYGTSAVPQSTFSPLVADAPYHLFSLGLGYRQNNWSIDAAGQFIYRETRHIANNVASPIVDGTWDNKMYGLMLTFTTRL